MIVIWWRSWSTHHTNMGSEDFLQRLLFNGNFCLEHEEKENRRIITSTEFNPSTSAVLKILSPVFTQFTVMPSEGEVVRRKEPLLAWNGVINWALPWYRATGRGEAEAKFLAGLRKAELFCWQVSLLSPKDNVKFEFSFGKHCLSFFML